MDSILGSLLFHEIYGSFCQDYFFDPHPVTGEQSSHPWQVDAHCDPDAVYEMANIEQRVSTGGDFFCLPEDI